MGDGRQRRGLVLVNPAAGTLTDLASWRATHTVPILLALVAMALAWRAPTSPPAQPVGPGGGFGPTLRDAGVRRWVVAETVSRISWASILTYVGAVHTTGHGVSAGVTGWILAAGATCFVATSLLSRRLIGQRPLATVVSAAGVAMAVAVVALFGSAVLPLGTASGALLGGLSFAAIATAAGVWVTASSLLGMAQAPEHPGVMMTLRTVSLNVGYLVGGALTGALIATLGWGAPGPVLACLLVVSAVVVRGLRGTLP